MPSREEGVSAASRMRKYYARARTCETLALRIAEEATTANEEEAVKLRAVAAGYRGLTDTYRELARMASAA